jgi:hypothetical protein
MSSPSNSTYVSKYSVIASLVLIGTLFFCLAKYSTVNHPSYLRASVFASSLVPVDIIRVVAPAAAASLSALSGFEHDDASTQEVIATSLFRQHGQLDSYLSSNLVMGITQKLGEENFAIFVGSLLVSSRQFKLCAYHYIMLCTETFQCNRRCCIH